MDTSQYIGLFPADDISYYAEYPAAKDAACELFGVFDFSELPLCVPTSEKPPEPLILANSRSFLVPEVEEEAPAPEAFACGECSRTFQKRRYLKDHLKIHRDERPFQCQECEFSFKFIAVWKDN